MPKKAINTSKEMQAYLGIKNLIFERVINPGQKVIYRDLEEMLGMSKTPIINAFARLEQESGVEDKRKRSEAYFFVAEMLLLENDRESAKNYLKSVIKLNNVPSNEHVAATAELDRIGG